MLARLVSWGSVKVGESQRRLAEEKGSINFLSLGLVVLHPDLWIRQLIAANL